MKDRMKLAATVGFAFAVILLGTTGIGQPADKFQLVSTIAFTSTRDDPGNPNVLNAAEIYLMNEDGTNLRRLTENMDGDAFPALSLNGKKIVFDSNRNRTETEPLNTSDLFVTNTDATEQTFLIRGSSASWSPDSKNVVFHASASGTGLPIRSDPGAATSDSDIFVINVDDGLTGAAGRKNITNSPLMIDDDANWSPDGQKLVFTSHSIFDNPLNSATAEIYVINADGTGDPARLTFNDYEERAPSWSPDGSRIVFMCRIGNPTPGSTTKTFEICVMNADGTNLVRFTNNVVFDGTPTFSPDGQKIVFHRAPAPQQMWMMNADGSAQTQLTFPPGFNNLANWGVLRVKSNTP
jgi:Tol biopolymer transport system component